MMPSGWFIVLAALALLPAGAARAAFTLAGIGVEVFGLAVVVRSHAASRGGEE